MRAKPRWTSISTAILALLSACGNPEVDSQNRLYEDLSLLWAENPTAFREELARIPDPPTRDLVRLRLAIADPARAALLCREAETDGAREKCRQVLGRPHLGSRPQPEPAP